VRVCERVCTSLPYVSDGRASRFLPLGTASQYFGRFTRGAGTHTPRQEALYRAQKDEIKEMNRCAT